MKRIFAATTTLVIAVSGFSVACSAPRKPALAITHVTIIDGTGAPPQQDMTLLIADQHIAALGPSGSTAIPRSAQMLDATDKFLIGRLLKRADLDSLLLGAERFAEAH